MPTTIGDHSAEDRTTSETNEITCFPAARQMGCACGGTPTFLSFSRDCSAGRVDCETLRGNPHHGALAKKYCFVYTLICNNRFN
jgi:hypothetical protein